MLLEINPPDAKACEAVWGWLCVVGPAVGPVNSAAAYGN